MPSLQLGLRKRGGVRRDSERSMFSDPWLPILPNAVLEKLIPRGVLTPGMVRLQSLYEYLWLGVLRLHCEHLGVTVGFPEGCPGHCHLPPPHPQQAVLAVSTHSPDRFCPEDLQSL